MLLSILDQSPISEGSTGADALRNTLDLARLGDELGYRFHSRAGSGSICSNKRDGALGLGRARRVGDMAVYFAHGQLRKRRHTGECQKAQPK